MFPGVSKLDLCAAGTSIIIITQECFPRILIGKYYSPLSKGIKKTKWLPVPLRLPRSKFYPQIKRGGYSKKYKK